MDALRIRVAVFVLEQGLPAGWDPEAADKVADHHLATREDKAIGTARVRELEPGDLKIERMAVLAPYRRQGIGTALTHHLLRAAFDRRPRRIWLDAQCAVSAFYEELSFTAVSEPHCPWGLSVPHVRMEYGGSLSAREGV